MLVASAAAAAGGSGGGGDAGGVCTLLWPCESYFLCLLALQPSRFRLFYPSSSSSSSPSSHDLPGTYHGQPLILRPLRTFVSRHLCRNKFSESDDEDATAYSSGRRTRRERERE